MKKIGILYICTGKYDIFWKDFYLSCEKYLLNDIDENGNKKFEKHYFVWTDSKEIFNEDIDNNIYKFYQENLGWPGNTLMRFDMFLSRKNELEKMDYIFFFNANCLILENISEKYFLPDIENKEYLMAALHPGFFNKNRKVFTYENKNIDSLAFISENEGEKYFMGALNGGVAKNFLEACEIMNTNTKKDLEKNIIAIFHDESHWNRYLVGRNDIKILGPEYLKPEDWNLRLDKNIKCIIRDKYKYFPVLKDRLRDSNFLKSFYLVNKNKIGRLLKRYGLRKY